MVYPIWILVINSDKVPHLDFHFLWSSIYGRYIAVKLKPLTNK
jgi:hypothetical protein